jgi:hypothetical protein
MGGKWKDGSLGQIMVAEVPEGCEEYLAGSFLFRKGKRWSRGGRRNVGGGEKGRRWSGERRKNKRKSEGKK